MSRQASYFDRTVKLHTPEQMFKRLEAITGKPIPQAGSPQGGSVVSAASQPTATADGVAPTANLDVAARSSPRDRHPLQWFAPTRTPEGPQMRSQCGVYLIRKASKAQQATYQLYKGKAALGPPYVTLDACQALAQRDSQET